MRRTHPSFPQPFVFLKLYPFPANCFAMPTRKLFRPVAKRSARLSAIVECEEPEESEAAVEKVSEEEHEEHEEEEHELVGPDGPRLWRAT